MNGGVKHVGPSKPQYTYASIDIETLGLDSSKHKIIEVAVVLDNHLHRINYSTINDYVKGLPYYHCYIRHDSYDGDPYAVNMNKHIIDIIEGRYVPEDYIPNIITLDELAFQLDKFFSSHCTKKIMPAGKNFSGFDRLFLDAVPGVKEVLDKWLIHRCIDPAILFFDENVDDRLPSLQQCLERANFTHKVSHTAPEDARDVIRCLRYKWDFNPIYEM